MSTITHVSGSFQALVDGYDAAIPSRSIVHVILGRESPDVTLRPPGLRAGRLKLVFPDSALAWAAVSALSVPQMLTLTDPDVSEVGMTFVIPEGDLTPRLDAETRKVWEIEVPFQEVTP